jgi:hypothetical protein
MKISSALQSLSVSGQQVSENNSMAKLKKDFEAIGAALDAGDLTAAKKAYAQLQSDAPSKTDGTDPIGKMMKALGEAINSGDLDSAQKQYAKIKEELSKNPPGGQGNGSGGAKGAPPAGGSSSNDIYDVRDTNKDGTVSTQEQLAYDLKHPANMVTNSTTTQTSASSSNNSSSNNTVGESIDIQA